MWLHPALGEAMAVADLAVPTVVGLTLLFAILRGDDVTCARAFRLLRWITNRPEPRGPSRSECECCNRHQTAQGVLTEQDASAPPRVGKIPLP